MKILLDSLTHTEVHIKLYKDVANVEKLRHKLMSGDLQCCIVKPSLICDPFQIVVAANKAAICEKTTTKSIFTEILYNLSISKNITNSLRTFGIDDKDKNLLVVTLVKDGEESHLEAYKQIEGEEISLKNLSDYCDCKSIKKIYKISEMEANSVPLIDSVVSRIATKDFLSH